MHEPKYSSIVSTIASTRDSFSAWPWGSRLRCATFAAVNRLAAPFGHAATHAPQPMHSAASIDASATGLGIGIRLASGEPPVGAVMKPPLSMMRSNAPRSHIRSLMIGNDARAPRLDDDLVAVAERAHVQLARRGAALRTVGLAVDHQ